MLNGFISLTVVYLLCSNYVVKKGHEQVEKTLEMKKWSRNGKVIKQGRNVYPSIALIKHSLNYIKTSDSLISGQPLAVQRTN